MEHTFFASINWKDITEKKVRFGANLTRIRALPARIPDRVAGKLGPIAQTPCLDKT